MRVYNRCYYTLFLEPRLIKPPETEGQEKKGKHLTSRKKTLYKTLETLYLVTTESGIFPVNGQSSSFLQSDCLCRSWPNQRLIKCPVADFILKRITPAFTVMAERLPTSLHMNGQGGTSVELPDCGIISRLWYKTLQQHDMISSPI